VASSTLKQRCCGRSPDVILIERSITAQFLQTGIGHFSKSDVEPGIVLMDGIGARFD
jgi:hypothetical protein